MLSRKKLDPIAIRASLGTACPHCGTRIAPEEYDRVDWEHLKVRVAVRRFSRHLKDGSTSMPERAELDRPADFFGEQTTVRRIYLRIFAHVNEHYGQSVAYARLNGIVPPWSQTQKPE